MKHIIKTEEIDEVLEENVNVSRRAPVKTLILILSGIMIVTVLLFIFLFFLGSVLANLVPQSVEQKIGTYVKNNYLIENVDKEKTEKAKNILEILNSENRYEVYVINDYRVNALAIPGNIILIYEGLFDKSDDNELSFVIAHELAHFKNRDHLKSFVQLMFVGAVVKLVNQESAFFLMNKAIDYVSLIFSRGAEYKADILALELMKEKNMNTSGAQSFMKKMLQLEGENNFEYFSTHPKTENRLKKVEEELIKIKN